MEIREKICEKMSSRSFKNLQNVFRNRVSNIYVLKGFGIK